MDRAWFEHRQVPALQGGPWIPLRANLAHDFARPGAGVLDGEIYFGCATLAVPEEQFEAAEKLDWSDLDPSSHRPRVDEDGIYRPVDTFQDHRSAIPIGVNLVIDQLIELERHRIWRLHPDLILALGLIEEGDTWYRPEEGWAEVVRLSRDANGEPVLLEIRAEFLFDYLSARGMALYVSSYHQRTAKLAGAPAWAWPGNEFKEQGEREHRDGWVQAKPNGAKVMGALWRTEWVRPAGVSLRVRGDRDPEPPTFFADAGGDRKPPETLRGARDWLYFKPELALALARHRGARLGWYSRDTGAIGATATTVHFGINRLGLINIYAKDIGDLAPWEQRIWAAHNVTHEGGVSAELFAAQMEVRPADTVAPEHQIEAALQAVDDAVRAITGAALLRPHEALPRLLRRITRFRAAAEDGLLTLAKDLTRLFIERVEVKPIHAALALKKDEKPGSLKSLERLLAARVGAEAAAAEMAPLFGIYDLRGADAHIGDGLIKSGLERARVDQAGPPAAQGRQLLEAFVGALHRLAAGLGAGQAAEGASP